MAENTNWFYTKEWQEKEREADEDFANNRFKTFKTIKALIDYLRSKCR